MCVCVCVCVCARACTHLFAYECITVYVRVHKFCHSFPRFVPLFLHQWMLFSFVPIWQYFFLLFLVRTFHRSRQGLLSMVCLCLYKGIQACMYVCMCAYVCVYACEYVGRGVCVCASMFVLLFLKVTVVWSCQNDQVLAA